MGAFFVLYSFLLLLNRQSNTQARTTDTSEARYEVSRADRSHEGSYLCRAANEAGQAERMVQVVVQKARGPGQGGNAR